VTGTGPPSRRVLVAGLVPPGPSGMRDYGRLVAAGLRDRGFDASEWWLEAGGADLRQGLGAAARLLGQARRVPRGSVVLVNYSPFAYAFRGIPLPGILLGIVLRARGIPVVTVFHEIAYPWGRRGLAGRVFSLAQHAALLPVLLGSTALLVTTEERARFLRRYGRLGRRRPVHLAPVFSTLGQQEPSEGLPGPAGTIGVIGHGADGAQPALFFAAVRGLRPGPPERIVLLGAPGRHSPAGQQWLRTARHAGLEGAVDFTGVLDPEELGRRIAACDVVVLVDDEGPSSRRTMLAAALAHGRPVVASDGPSRWDAPVEAGAIVVVPAEAGALGAALQRLTDDAAARASTGALAFAFYEREMSLARTCDEVSAMLGGLSGAARRRTRSC
jgi:glycosyltransferase involved in cell wall biosynthesis